MTALQEAPPSAAPARAPLIATPSRRYRRRHLAYKAAMYLLLVAFSAFILLPAGWMLTAALKPDLEPVFTTSPEWWPTEFFQWDNFRRVMTDTFPFLRYIVNTTVIVVANVIGVLLSCSLVAFAFARLRFSGSKVLFTILIITMLIPWQALMVPQFLLFVELGWYGTYLPLIVPSFGGSAFFIFLIRQYMRTIPRDLDDAARVDGLNTWQIFWRIILPLSTPALTVCAVFTFRDLEQPARAAALPRQRGQLHRLDRVGEHGPAGGDTVESADGGQPDHDAATDHHLLLPAEEADRRDRVGRTQRLRREQTTRG
jgi:multiple sugar transport system permease protein